MKKLFVSYALIAAMLFCLTSIIYAYYVVIFESANIIVSTGSLKKEVYINNSLVAEQDTAVDVQIGDIVFYDMLVDYSEPNIESIFNENIIVIDVLLKNSGTIDYDFTFSCTSQSNLLIYQFISTDEEDYFTKSCELLANEDTTPATSQADILNNMNRMNSEYFSSKSSLTVGEELSFKIMVYGYQPDAKKQNSDFIYDAYSLTISYTATQREEVNE